MRFVLTSLLAALAVAAPAQAAEVAVTNGTLRLDGGSQFVDADVVQEGTSFTVTDFGLTLEAGDGCSHDTPEVPLVGPVSERTFTCTGVTVAFEATVGGEGNYLGVSASLPKRLLGGPGDDALIGSGTGVTEAQGGAGEDYLSGGESADALDGGAGDDALRGGGEADRLSGGEGGDSLDGDHGSCCLDDPGMEIPPPSGTADLLDGGPGADNFGTVEPSDRLTGGDGRDTAHIVSKAPVTVGLGAGGLDVESVSIAPGDATVRGDARANEIRTSEGKDTVDAGAGFDKVLSGPGDDTVTLRDGFPDFADCGEGTDRVVADEMDEVDGSCETVERAPSVAAPGAAPAARALIAPDDLVVSVRRKGRRVIVRGRLVLPGGTPKSLCTGGGVTLQIRGLARRALRRGTVLDGRCGFTVTLKGRRRGKVRVRAYFAGTPGIGPLSRTRSRSR